MSHLVEVVLQPVGMCRPSVLCRLCDLRALFRLGHAALGSLGGALQVKVPLSVLLGNSARIRSLLAQMVGELHPGTLLQVIYRVARRSVGLVQVQASEIPHEDEHCRESVERDAIHCVHVPDRMERRQDGIPAASLSLPGRRPRR